MLTKTQKQIKSFLQYTAFTDLGLVGMLLVTLAVTIWTNNEVRRLLGDPADIGFGWGLIFGGWTLYIGVVLAAMACLAILVCSFIIKIYLFGLLNKDGIDVANFVVPLVTATFVTAILGILGLVLLLTGNVVFWFIMTGIFVVEGAVLLWLSLWPGLFEKTVA